MRRRPLHGLLPPLLALASGGFLVTGNLTPFGQAPEPLEERQVGGDTQVNLLNIELGALLPDPRFMDLRLPGTE